MVLLLHSFLCSGRMWRGQVPELAQRYRVVNLELRGHDRSYGAPPPVTMADLVDDAIALLDHLEIPQAAWVGLSIGGMISMRAALAAPDRVGAMALLNSDAGAETWQVKAKHGLLKAIAGRVGLRPVMSRILRLMFGRTALKTQPDLISEWRSRFERVDLPSTFAVLDGLDGRDSILEQLSDIAVPTLVLAGAEDMALPPQRAEAIHQNLPGATFHSLPRVGHLSALEAPEAVTRHLLAFLEDAWPVVP